MPVFANRIDVCKLAPRDRGPVIGRNFGRLAPGESLELIDDHDAQPL